MKVFRGEMEIICQLEDQTDKKDKSEVCGCYMYL